MRLSFSALQRAEIAEIQRFFRDNGSSLDGFSALQRAEIAEIWTTHVNQEHHPHLFQCSSTSRNC